MGLTDDDVKRIREIFREEIESYFENDPMAVDRKTHYDHHQQLTNGCMSNKKEIGERDADHGFIREVRGAGGKVRKEVLTWATRGLLLLAAFGAFKSFAPFIEWISHAFKATGK